MFGNLCPVQYLWVYLTDHYFLYIPYLLGGWSPTIASYIVLVKNGKLNSFKEWLKTVFDFKHNAYSYFMLLALAMVFLLPQCLISGYKMAHHYSLLSS